jgi:cell division transport system ATP-binding protein
MVGIPGKANLFPGQLAGGEIQRASIARAIACEPQYLFADEPTGNLDEATSVEIFELLRKINTDGTTIIMATHDVTLIDLHKSRHIQIEKGQIASDSADTKEKKKTTHTTKK